MNSETYNSLETEQLAALRAAGTVFLKEDIPTGTVVFDDQPMSVVDAVAEARMAAKRAEERAFYGGHKTRSGYTKVGQQPRDKAKAKAARQARKVNRQRGRR